MAAEITPFDGQILNCSCGRVWRVGHVAPDAQRRGRVVCRCNAPLGQDDAGAWTATLESPREQFPQLRRFAGQIGLLLFRLARTLRIPMWRWFRLSSLIPFLNSNTASHVRVEMSVAQQPKR